MKRANVGLVLIGVAAVGALVWWIKRRQTVTSATGAKVLVPQITSIGPFDFVTGYSWQVAPAQPATPNTPTVDPVWAKQNPGVSPV